MALDHATVDAEREAFLLLGADVAGERDRFSVRAGNGGDGPHRPDFSGRLRLVAAAQESQAEPGRARQQPSQISFHASCLFAQSDRKRSMAKQRAYLLMSDAPRPT